MGDMNAQISRNRDGFEQMMIGPFGSASHTNNNGERLILFCGINDHCIENSYFRHKMIHKYTWRSPDGHAENEIDYFCISQRWRSALQDVRSYRGADTGSDHQIFRSSLKLKFTKIKRTSLKKTIAVEILKNEDVADKSK